MARLIGTTTAPEFDHGVNLALRRAWRMVSALPSISYRRMLADMHISGLDPAFLSRYDQAVMAEQLARAICGARGGT